MPQVRRSSSQSIATLAISALLLGSSACGSTSSPEPGGSTDGREDNGSDVTIVDDAGDDSADSEDDAIDGPGIVVATCRDYEIEVVLVDPDSGEVSEQRTFDLSTAESRPLRCYEGRAFENREKFDRGFTRLAVDLEGRATGTSVGFVDTSGTVVDVTAMRDGGGDFDEPLVDRDPLFDQTDGRLIAASESSGSSGLVSLDPDTGELVELPATGSAGSGSFALGPNAWVVDDSDEPQLPNPSGTHAVDAYGEIHPRPGTVSATEDGMGSHLALAYLDVPDDGCTPTAWTSDTSYLCVDTLPQSRGSLVRVLDPYPADVPQTTDWDPMDPCFDVECVTAVTGGPAPRLAVETIDVIPVVSGRTYWGLLPSPEAAQFAFLSSQEGDDVGLYVGAIDGSSTPRKIEADIALSKDSIILAWLP